MRCGGGRSSALGAELQPAAGGRPHTGHKVGVSNTHARQSSWPGAGASLGPKTGSRLSQQLLFFHFSFILPFKLTVEGTLYAHLVIW